MPVDPARPLTPLVFPAGPTTPPRTWSRRAWLRQQAQSAVGAAVLATWTRARRPRGATLSVERAARVAAQATRLEPANWEALAQYAVDAAQQAGAPYAEARLTRWVQHNYNCEPFLLQDHETVGVGVRALVDGCWGFAASMLITPEEVVRLVQDAVGQAKENAKGPPCTVDLGLATASVGRWATPVTIDPFTVSIEEKLDFIEYWKQCVDQMGMVISTQTSFLWFGRQERVVATSEGARFTQTLFETGGALWVSTPRDTDPAVLVHGITTAGAGWERFLDAHIPEQFFSGQLREEIRALARIPHRPSRIGKYTIVCDGATMAALTEATLGMATQLDRALGYEANAGGSTWLDDPLGLLGTLVAGPAVTLTANRSAPGGLATVKWDDEGVTPETVTLVKDGVLVDFQTTREQATWLKPYYDQHQLPVRSHGYAASESAHVEPLQHMPNLVLEPQATGGTLDELIASVPEGLLLVGGTIRQADSQARSGLLMTYSPGMIREIKHGKLGAAVDGGAVFFDSPTLWKAITAVGNASTVAEGGYSTITWPPLLWELIQRSWLKGQPPQRTSHTIQAAAAVIADQPLIDPRRKV